jgi:hypothetical protein
VKARLSISLAAEKEGRKEREAERSIHGFRGGVQGRYFPPFSSLTLTLQPLKIRPKTVFTRCDKVVPGLGARTNLLLLLLLLLPVSEFWSFYTQFSILQVFCQLFDNFFDNF